MKGRLRAKLTIFLGRLWPPAVVLALVAGSCGLLYGHDWGANPDDFRVQFIATMSGVLAAAALSFFGWGFDQAIRACRHDDEDRRIALAECLVLDRWLKLCAVAAKSVETAGPRMGIKFIEDGLVSGFQALGLHLRTPELGPHGADLRINYYVFNYYKFDRVRTETWDSDRRATSAAKRDARRERSHATAIRRALRHTRRRLEIGAPLQATGSELDAAIGAARLGRREYLMAQERTDAKGTDDE